jgi:prepilin-type N-terminal cleavage/methylation domain-containing protein
VGSKRGLTLVELLVAVSLGTILIGIITVVWVQSSRIVTETVERLEVYQNLRQVLDSVERDLANATRSVDMEFFQDANANGRFDGDSEKFKADDGKYFRDPRDGLPKEFADDKLNDIPYFYAPVISSPPPYVYNRPNGVPEAHWRDEVYVRSFAMVGGINRSALVHYRLVGTEKGRPSLRRRVWYLNKDNKIKYDPVNLDASSDRAAIIADGILDLKVGFVFKENTITGNGVLYHVRSDTPAPAETSSTEIMQLIDRDSKRFSPCFGTINSSPPSPSPLKKTHRLDGGVNAITFYYEGWGKFEFTDLVGVRFRPLKGLITDPPPDSSTPDYITSYDTFDFPGVRLGDKVYIFDAVDDDSNHDESIRSLVFPDRYFTVQDVRSEFSETADGSKDPSGPRAISIQFAEVIDYYRLKGWLGIEDKKKIGADGKPGVDITLSSLIGQASNVRVSRTITQSFNAKYRIGFLPSAFVVRLTYDDRRHGRVIPFERVIRLLAQ